MTVMNSYHLLGSNLFTTVQFFSFGKLCCVEGGLCSQPASGEAVQPASLRGGCAAIASLRGGCAASQPQGRLCSQPASGEAVQL